MAGPGSDSQRVSSAHLAPTPPTPPKQTCDTCRARKVKCDGRLDCCSNCERLQYHCSFRRFRGSHGPGTGAASSTVTLAARSGSSRRVSRACKNCHVAKSRCTGALPACRRCIAKGIDCVYQQPTKRSSRQRQPDLASLVAMPETDELVVSITPRPSRLPQPQSPNDMLVSPTAAAAAVTADPDPDPAYHQYALLTRTRVLSAIRAFFDRFHPLPSLSFLHKRSLLRLYGAQEADLSLIASIVAVASRLPGTTPEEMTIGFQCADLAEDIVRNNLGQPSVFQLQALVLLLRFRLWTGSSNGPLVFASHLARSAFLLRLNHETFRPSSFFVREARRRLMWSIYMLDVVLADGLEEYAACPITDIHIQLPCTEDDFELNIETLSEPIDQTAANPSGPRLGIIAYHVRVVYLSNEVLRYTKRLIDMGAESTATDTEFLALEKQLDLFQSRLPEHERLSEKNMSMRAFSPRLSRWVMTHILWHACHCQLFRCLVPEVPAIFSQRLADHLGEALTLEYQRRCLDHAVSVASIFFQLREMAGDTCVLDMEMAECAFKTSEILLLSSESTRRLLGLTQADIFQHANACLQFAESMLGMYPAVGPIVSDLSRALQSFSQGGTCSFTVSTGHTSPMQLISKHSALYRSAFVDDIDKLEMHENSSKATSTSPHTATGSMIGDEQASLRHYGGFAQDAMSSIHDDSQVDFSEPGVVHSTWDHSQMFQAPFEAGELDAPHIGGSIRDLRTGTRFSVGSAA